jgi:hypothetical protein
MRHAGRTLTMTAAPQPAPILRVTVGTPVYSADDHKLGKVKAIRAGHFQVETGLFQRDYWLSGELVQEAVPEHSVHLAVPNAELGAHKLPGEPAAA